MIDARRVNRVQKKFGSFAMFIYGLEEKLGSLVDIQEINVIKMAEKDRVPHFHASLDDWKQYKEQLKAQNKTKYFVVEGIETIVVALALALLVRRYIIMTSVVPTGSMIPT